MHLTSAQTSSERRGEMLENVELKFMKWGKKNSEAEKRRKIPN